MSSFTRKILFISMLTLIFASQSYGVEVTYTITQGSDDVFQEGLTVYNNPSPFQLPDSWPRMLGLRFDNISIPKGSTITSAEIILTSSATKDQAGRFRTVVENSADPITYSTANNVWDSRNYVWNPLKDWTVSGTWSVDTEKAINVKDLVQNRINNSGWNSGQAIAFFTYRRDWNPNYEIYSFENDPTKAAKLVIDYEADIELTADPNPIYASTYTGYNAQDYYFTLENTGTVPTDYSISSTESWVSCTNNCSGTLNAGSSISVTLSYNNLLLTQNTYVGSFDVTGTYGGDSETFEVSTSLSVIDPDAGSACGNVPIYAQNLVDPAILILLDVSGSMAWDAPLFPSTDNKRQTSDIKGLIQEVVNKADWLSGNSMAFTFSKADHAREAYTFNKNADFAPKLFVTYTSGGVTTTISNQIANGIDDVEGSTYGTTNGNELNFEDNVVGLRFVNVEIPPSASIDSAYIEFVAIYDRPAQTSNEIDIQIEDSNNAEPFYEDGSSKTWIPDVVTWDANDEWNAIEQSPKIDIAQDVISQLVEDQAISWGFGEWSASKPHSSTYDLYTVITSGVQHRDDDEIDDLQDIIRATTPNGGTPLQSSLRAGLEYFLGNKSSTEGTSTTSDDKTYNASATCQPKFLISISDGLGNTDGSSVTTVTERTNELADNDISTVAVGFGIDNATQIQAIAETANDRGDADDDLYALHEEDADGDGQPFLANNQEELYTSLNTITDNIKKAIFIGASPAPSTSVQFGSFVLNATFNAGDWTGDVTAIPYDSQTQQLLMCVNSLGTQTCDQASIAGTCVYEEDGQCTVDEILLGNECICWTASDKMPDVSAMSAWTVAGYDSVNGSGLTYGDVGKYVDSTTPGSDEIDLDGDNYICKELGDIIKSTPVIVNPPSAAYAYDKYAAYKYGSLRNRDSMAYVGANDGALHAFDLNTGVEKWRFYPERLHEKIKNNDLCDEDYCHVSFVDGTPIAEDVYLGTDYDAYLAGVLQSTGWRTMLLTGLGEGGDAYFALDISSANDFSTSSSDSLTNTQFLYQFTDTELGLTTGIPVITKVADTTATNGGFAAYFGSGYDSGGSMWKESYIYGINAYTMEPIWITGVANRIDYTNNSSDLTNTNIGETITGSVSGASGEIAFVDEESSTDGTIVLVSLSGDFSIGEDLIMEISGTDTVVGEVTGELHELSVNRMKIEDVDRITYSGRITGNTFAAGQTIKGNTSEATAVISEIVQDGTSSFGTLILDMTTVTNEFDISEDLMVETSTGVFEKYAVVSHDLHSAYSNDAVSDVVLADLDYDSKSDYMYFGTLYGRFFRAQNISYGEEPVISPLFDIHPSSIDRSTPIRAGATLAFDQADDTIWTYFGSGKFENQADKFNADQQYFVGLKDVLGSTVAVPVQTLSDLLPRATESVTSSISGTSEEYRTMTGHTYTYSVLDGSITTGTTVIGYNSGVKGTISALSGGRVTFNESTLTGTFEIGELLYDEDHPATNTMVLTASSWYATLQTDGSDPSERVVARSLVAGGVVFFTSFIPDDDVCAGSGNAWLYALDYDTGLPTNEPVFDVNGDGAYNDSDKIGGKNVVAIPIGRGIPSAPVLEGDVILVNTTDSGGGSGGGPPGPTIIPPNLPGLQAALTTWKDGQL